MTHRSALLTLLLAACGTTIDLEASNLDLESLQYGIAAYDTLTEQESGLQLFAYSVILSDRADLCSALGDTESGDLDEIDDVFAVQVVGLSVTGSEGFESFNTNAPFLKPILDPEDGDSVTAIEVLERRGGETVFNQGTSNLIDIDETSDSRMSVGSRSMSNGSLNKVSISFRGTLDMDRVDVDNFDVDVTDDGVPDYARVSSSIKGRIAGATGCDALGSL